MKADQFEMVVMKHGEQGVQLLLENWERFQGIRHIEPLPLEDRWQRFIAETDEMSSFDA